MTRQQSLFMVLIWFRPYQPSKECLMYIRHWWCILVLDGWRWRCSFALACLTTRPAVRAKMLEMAYSSVCVLRLICLNTMPWTRAANRKFKCPTNTMHRPIFITYLGTCTLAQDTSETETQPDNCYKLTTVSTSCTASMNNTQEFQYTSLLENNNNKKLTQTSMKTYLQSHT